MLIQYLDRLFETPGIGKVSRNHNTSVNGLELIGVSGKPDLANSESMAMKMFIHISDAVLIITIHIYYELLINYLISFYRYIGLF